MNIDLVKISLSQTLHYLSELLYLAALCIRDYSTNLLLDFIGSQLYVLLRHAA